MQRTPAVDQAISAAVGDVGRPVRHFPFSRDLDHVPGRTGTVSGLLTLLRMVRQGEAFFTGERERYGPVFRLYVGPDPIVCVADAQMLWDIGVNRERIWSSALPWAYLLGGVNRRSATVDGPLAVDGEYHKDVREILRHAFSAAALASYLQSATAIFDDRFRLWQARRRVPFKAELRRLLADVSAKMFLGIDDPRESEALDHATEDAWRAPQALLKRSRFSRTWRRAMDGYDRLWSLLRPQVETRRAGNGVDLFSRMCRGDTAGTWLTDDALVRLLISTMMAAFDTTASGLASMAYLLCAHPDWQERLREEARARSGAPLTLELLQALEQHHWVWQETLRVFPVAGQLNRQSLAETQLGGHRIPAGAYVLGLTGTTMWDPRYWSEPKRFDPERFSPARAEHKRHPGAYLPFGVGNHVCLGAQIASLEALAFFSRLLARYRLRQSPPYTPAHNYLPFGVVSGRLDVELDAV
jgi:cytochrome P450